MKLLLFTMTGLMSGVAGVVYSFRFASASPSGASGYELAVIASVLFGGVAIAGGVGTMWGVLAAVMVLGVIRSVLQLSNVSSNALLIVSGSLLLISVVLLIVPSHSCFEENIRTKNMSTYHLVLN